ncbi:MAG: heme exporter protein CcmB [Edaphocola sp.]
MLQPLITLIKKDLLLEWRQKHTLFGVVLYVGCTVLVLYMMTGAPESKIWNALFWVAMLFVTVNTVAKSFLQEGDSRLRYYYTLVPPVVYVLSKMAYSLVLMVFMTLLSLLLFTILLGNPLIHFGTFLLVALLGAAGMSLLFTFLSAIAAQARQNAALMAILGFPIAIPLLLILSHLAVGAVSPVVQEGWWSMAWLMAGMDVLIIALAAILFPFLWKE